ncbi:unnamed protein product [Meloidogyne enterolobii]|uniref:Uncharacterized protein n=1 Tax=Meloidogyne enterolobii TaxID=390850 RepID=A0ACB0XKC0_MELEN
MAPVTREHPTLYLYRRQISSKFCAQEMLLTLMCGIFLSLHFPSTTFLGEGPKTPPPLPYTYLLLLFTHSSIVNNNNKNPHKNQSINYPHMPCHPYFSSSPLQKTLPLSLFYLVYI